MAWIRSVTSERERLYGNGHYRGGICEGGRHRSSITPQREYLRPAEFASVLPS